MTKKLGTGLDSLIRDSKEDKPKVGRPREITREITKSSQDGLREGWTRATFIVKEESLEKIKDLAYWERKQVKEVIDEAIELYLKGKSIKPRPKNKE